MPSFFGLHFGNTNMCLAMHKESTTDVLANARGDRVTPSVIAFVDESEKYLVGMDAKQRMVRNPSSAVTNIKDRISNNSEPELNHLESKPQTKVNGKKNNKGDFEINGYISQYKAEDFLTILFSNMKALTMIILGNSRFIRAYYGFANQP
ncbi:heat shock protein 14 [Caerostris extrusa]|uniref:Heat shock protein 14 n=1 Tax=Caerostris extrusa TaxID=172846 RepID=A0AAV4PKE0_CAEEX|nr:heat shock protein 14 [Caerostris extrusa]